MKKKKDGFQGQKAIVLPRKILTKHCIHNPLIDGCYITDIGYYPKARFHYRVRQQGVDQHILIYNVEGLGWVEIEGERYDIVPGDFFLVPAGKSNCYAADEKKPWSIYWIHFKGSVADAFIQAFYQRFGSWRDKISNNQSRVKIFEEMYTHLEKGYGHDNLTYVNMVLLHFLSSFLYSDNFDNVASTHKIQDAINKSIQHMQDCIGENLSLESLAAQVNLSVSHYSSLFRKKSGFSPIEYFNHLKIQKACQFLQFTDLRIKEISNEIGMEDPYYFSRLFTKVMSISPREYRARHQYK